MVRTVSGTLQTAIGAKTRRPVIKLTSEDHINHLHNAVSTNGNADGFSDMCVALDGSIIRVRVTWAGAGNEWGQNFQYQRITDPTNATQWQTWTTFAGGSGNVWDRACCVVNNAGTLRAFAQQGTGGSAIWNWYSSDNGQTWSGAPGPVLTPPSNANLKGIGSAGNNDVFFLYDVVGGDAIGASFYNGGAWGSLVPSTLPVLFDGDGMAVVWNSGLYTLVYADPYNVYAATYNPGSNVWTVLPILAPTTTTAIGRRSPRISMIDGVYTLVYVEEDGGLFTGTVYNYPRVRQSVDLVNWSNGFILHDMPTQYNANIVKTQAPGVSRQQYIAVTAQVVEYNNSFSQSDPTQYVDLSSYVLEYQRVEEIGKPGKIMVLLDNSSGVLNSAVSQYGVTYKPIGINTTLVLSEGYKTGSPPTTTEVVQVGKYRMKQIAFERAPGKSVIQLEAWDVSSYLDYENRYQVTYTNTSIQSTMQNVTTLSGVITTNVPALGQMLALVTTYVLHAGQKYRFALDELCRIGWVEYFLDQNEVLQVVQLNPSDASVWTYQPEVETLVLGTNDERANHILVSGKPPAGPSVPLGSVTNAEVFDDTHLHVTGLERVSIYTDVKLFTSLLCQNKAAFLLAQEQRDQVAHSITVPANPALQLLDVITVSDQSAGVSGTGQTVKSRIYRQEVVFRAEKAEFDQTIDLEGV